MRGFGTRANIPIAFSDLRDLGPKADRNYPGVLVESPSDEATILCEVLVMSAAARPMAAAIERMIPGECAVFGELDDVCRDERGEASEYAGGQAVGEGEAVRV
jgi:hypothetical protein